ncbi:hypothetical protein HDU81_007127 [Chytriomyces hyalinus]|nr:hypothetical protein HDU81_007127 [Chytriomyces hyalinus]
MSASTQAPQPNTRLFPFLPAPTVTATSMGAGGLFDGFLNPLTSSTASSGSSSTRIPSTSTASSTITSTSSIIPSSTLPLEAVTTTTASTAPSNTIEAAQTNTLQPAVIAGIAAGSVAFVALLALAIICWCKRRKSAASNYAQVGRRSIPNQPSNDSFDAEANYPASNPLLAQPYHHQNPGAQISRGIVENVPSPHPPTPISKISPTESELISLRASWNLPQFDSSILAAQSTTPGQTAPPFNISNWILHRKATASTDTRIVTSPIVIERIIKTRVTPEGRTLYYVQYLDHPTLQEEWVTEDAIPAHELETFRNMNDNATSRRENLARSGSYGAGAFSQDEGVIISMDRVRGAGVVNVSNGSNDSAASVWFRPNVASILSGKTVDSGSDVGSQVSVVREDSQHK